MTIEALETGLCRLNQGQTGALTFWDENITAFRLTVLVAIRETSDMIASSDMALEFRIELERQEVLLQRYLKLADNYLCSRRFSSHSH